MLDALAQAAAARTGHPADAWADALRDARPLVGRARLDPDDLRRVVEASPSPETFTRLVALLAEQPVRHPADPGPLAALREAAAPFPFSIEAWLRALGVFNDFLHAKGQSSSFPAMLAYLACVAESATMQATRPALAVHLRDMLEAFGFEDEEEGIR